MKKMSHFFKDNQGVVLIEFAFILPILLLLTFPMIDYARYVLLQQKIIKVAYVLGDSITISNPIDVATTAVDVAADPTYFQQLLLDDPNGPDLIDTLPQLMLPFREAPNENLWQVVISYVYKPDPGTPPQLMWQYDEDSRSFTAGSRVSNIGIVSGFTSPIDATLPTELINTMASTEGLIVVEVTGRHNPISPVMGALGIPFVSAEDLQYTSYMRTRYGDLQYMWANNCPPTSTVCP
ncbi:MAG: pilus assembly protein [Rickettsiales bacterium]|nr:pilus assembly protein [Rickettsiales bacterium]